MKERFKNYLIKDYRFDKMTFIGIICLIVVFSGIFGFVYEFIFYYFNSGMKEFYYRGGNFLPWINIYAIGAIIVYFLTFKYRRKPLKIFLFSMIICGVLELIAGWGIYVLRDGARYWDYNTEILNFGNIGGFICLRSVVFFGLSSLFLIYVMIPFCFLLARKVPKKVFVIVSISVCFIFILDELYNLIIARLLSLPRSSDIYKSLGIKYMSFK